VFDGTTFTWMGLAGLLLTVLLLAWTFLLRRQVRQRTRHLEAEINERKRAEAALKENIDLFSQFILHSPIYTYIKEVAPGRSFVLQASENFSDLTGIPGSKMVGKSMDELFPLEFARKMTADDWAVVSSGQVLELEEELNGRCYTTIKFPFPMEGKTYLAGYTIDISARKQAEQAQRLSEENYRLIFEQAADGIFITDALGNFIDVNPAGCAIIGYNRAETLSINLRSLFQKEEGDLISLRFDQMKTGQVLSIERQVIRREGTLVDVDITGRMLPDGCFQGVVRDITSRKQTQEKLNLAMTELQRLLEEADQSRGILLNVIEDQKISEEKLSRLNAELERRVAERTAQLEASNQELEAFTYSVSHDLRSPLRAVDGFSSILCSDYAGQLDEEGKNYLERIQQASQRMGQLISNLLNLSRTARTELTYRTVDLSEMAQAIAAELSAQAPGRQVTFKIEAGVAAQGDADLLKIALENLLNNACKFTSLQAAAVIEVGMQKQQGDTVYFVRDNGTGFSMEHADKLFIPFQRLHNAKDYPGTGIGLSIVQRIIVRHGGRIWPQSELGKGTTFYFTLGNPRES